MINPARRIIRLDPQYRVASRAPEYDPVDWEQLNALCKRPVDTPRAKLTPEQIAEILAQPEGKPCPSYSRRTGELIHGTIGASRTGCTCDVCVFAADRRKKERFYRQNAKKKRAGGRGRAKAK